MQDDGVTTVELLDEDDGDSIIVGTVETRSDGKHYAITPYGKTVRAYPSADEAGYALVMLWLTCAWFALCPNMATTTVPHFALGPVRACDRCAALAVPVRA